MMKLIIAALLLCPPRGGYCAPADAKPKTRALKEITELVLSQGEDTDVNVFGQALGLGTSGNSTKEIYYGQEITPDGFEHVYHVLTKGAKPRGIVWSVTKVTKSGEREDIEGFDYYLSLDGKLKAASTSRGLRGEVKFTPVALDSKTKSRFRKETEFWTKDSLSLKWAK